MSRWVTNECSCEVPHLYAGQKKPIECVHRNRFVRAPSVSYDVTGLPSGPTTVMKEKPRAALKRTRRKETKAERAARDHFNEKVKARACWFSWHRPCERCGGKGETEVMSGIWWTCTSCNGDGKHHCEGRKDAHHLIPKQYIRRHFQGVLPEDQFVAILFNPKIGAPLCRKAHDRIESGADRIYWSDLTDECIEYVGSLPDFMLLQLEEKCPKRDPGAYVESLAS